MLSPSNLKLIADKISLNVTVDVTGFNAEVQGVEMSIRKGIIWLALNGFDFGIDNLELPTVSVSGRVHLSGFRNFPNLKLVGVLGGKSSGTGVRVLFAAEINNVISGESYTPVLKPLGAALDVSGGSVGIPVYTTGILITGAEGGVSFANNNGDPTNFVTYLDPVDQVTVHHERSKDVRYKLPSDRPVLKPDCVCQCPPGSMNLFCQPHPDSQEQKAILKFSSLDVEFLQNIKVSINGEESQSIKDYLDKVDNKINSIVKNELHTFLLKEMMIVINAISEKYKQITNVAARPVNAMTCDLTGNMYTDIFEKIILTPELYWKEQFTAVISEELSAFVNMSENRPSLFTMLCKVAANGLPCPDISMQVTGTVSYTGVSAFLSVTGGVNISTAGSVGVIGTLNILGMPIGKLRAFLTFTSETGDLSPSLCGDLRCVIGPVDLGNLSFRYALPGFFADIQRYIIETGKMLGSSILNRIIGQCFPWIRDNVQFNSSDPASSLKMLSKQEAYGFLANLQS